MTERLKDWENGTYWYYDKDGKLYSSNEVKLRISSTDNSLHFGDVPQYAKDLHGLLPLSIKRPWVGLTDEEYKAIRYGSDERGYDYVDYELFDEGEYGMEINIYVDSFAKAIEAKLKEKNT